MVFDFTILCSPKHLLLEQTSLSASHSSHIFLLFFILAESPLDSFLEFLSPFPQSTCAIREQQVAADACRLGWGSPKLSVRFDHFHNGPS